MGNETAMRESQVQTAINELDSMVAEVEVRMANLTGRLENVVRPEVLAPPVPATPATPMGVPVQVSSNLTERLRVFSSRIESVLSLFDSLMDRLEL